MLTHEFINIGGKHGISCLNTYIHSATGAIEQCVLIAFDVIAATLSAYFCMHAIMLEGKHCKNKLVVLTMHKIVTLVADKLERLWL